MTGRVYCDLTKDSIIFVQNGDKPNLVQRAIVIDEPDNDHRQRRCYYLDEVGKPIMMPRYSLEEDLQDIPMEVYFYKETTELTEQDLLDTIRAKCIQDIDYAEGRIAFSNDILERLVPSQTQERGR